VSAAEAGLSLPALQADVRFADYEVDVPDVGVDDARSAVSGFLAAESVPWEHKREDQVRTYDIRALVHDITVRGDEAGVRLEMRLRSDSSGSGRPEQVVAALGLPPPGRIHRTRLVLAGTSPAIEAWRRRGRFANA